MILFCAPGRSAKICELGQPPEMTGGRWLMPGRLLSCACHPDPGDGQTARCRAETSHREEAGVGKSLAFGGHVAALSQYSLGDHAVALAGLSLWLCTVCLPLRPQSPLHEVPREVA